MAALLRKVDSVRCKELVRRTSRRSSPVEQTPQPKLVPGKRWVTKKLALVHICLHLVIISRKSFATAEAKNVSFAIYVSGPLGAGLIPQASVT